jgi:hypothetical protein
MSLVGRLSDRKREQILPVVRTDVCFRPSQAILPSIGIKPRHKRAGAQWVELVTKVSALAPASPQAMALTLTMRRLRRYWNVGVHMHQDAMCPHCAAGILEVFEGDEEDLLDFYYKNLADITNSLKHMRVRSRPRPEVVSPEVLAKIV